MTHTRLENYPAIRNENPDPWVLARAWESPNDETVLLLFRCPFCSKVCQTEIPGHGGSWPVYRCEPAGAEFGVHFDMPEQTLTQ